MCNICQLSQAGDRNPTFYLSNYCTETGYDSYNRSGLRQQRTDKRDTLRVVTLLVVVLMHTFGEF